MSWIDNQGIYWYLQAFEDDVEGGRNVSMYSTNDSTHDATDITFEPLPDILAKTVSTRALRPRITNLHADKQAVAAKAVSKYLFIWAYLLNIN